MSKQVLKFHNSRFENEARRVLHIFNRPLKESDALKVKRLDCRFDSDELFYPDDYPTLRFFVNLKILYLECREDGLTTLGHLSNMEELHISCIGWNQTFDFSQLSGLEKLKSLSVSGGDYSNMKLVNLEALSACKCLERLHLHEFGYIDLQPLKYLQQIKELYIGYGKQVDNTDVIKHLNNLEMIS